MSLRVVASLAAGAAGVTLMALGILHIALGLPSLQRAVERGHLAPQLAGPQMVNWLFSGAALSLLGALLLLWAPELRRGRRGAWRSASLTGLFLVLVGVGAYVWEPRAEVLIFAAVGLCVIGPLLAGARYFNEV